MYWVDEDAVTVVLAKTLKDVVVGQTRQVTVGKNAYTGKIVAMGKLDYNYNFSCNT